MAANTSKSNSKSNSNENETKKYVPLRDRRPKATRPKRELPGGGVLEFKSAFEFREGQLFTFMSRLQGLDEHMDDVPEVFRDLSHDPDENERVFNEDEELMDIDKIELLQEVVEEIFSQLGSTGESSSS